MPKIILTLHPLVQSRIRNLRRQRLAARLSQMVTAKPLGQLKKAGVVASFVTLARHDSKSGGTQSPPIQYGR